MFERIRNFWNKATASNKDASGTVGIRPSGSNPWGPVIGGMFMPRKVNPDLYEAIREAIAPIDGGINRLVTMDGIIAIEGGNEKLVQELTEFVEKVPVNDLDAGLQAFVDGCGNELYEQGFALGEYVIEGRDIVGLRVADSKGVHFQRDEDGQLRTWYQPPAAIVGRGDGTDRVQQVLRREHGVSASTLMGWGFSEVPRDRMIYRNLHAEADNPYGVSIMRSMEFVSQILLTIQNATGQTWSRFGDPPLAVTMKVKARLTPEQYAARATSLASDLAKVLEAKRKGNSADLVRVIGPDDDIKIEVIGAQGQIIEIEAPARHVLEQIVAKFGLPSWMLGFHWSTAERLAESQGTLVLQESQTRFTRSKPALVRMLSTLLRLRGRTWKPGDWDVVQRLPNLADELKKAQAAFLRAQTEMMLAGKSTAPTPAATTGQKAFDEAMLRISAKLVGMDDRAKAELLADPMRVDIMIDEIMEDGAL